MAIHRVQKVFRLDPAHEAFNEGKKNLIDCHSDRQYYETGIPRNGFTDLGEAEQWIKYNGGQGENPRFTIMEMIWFDYE